MLVAFYCNECGAIVSECIERDTITDYEPPERCEYCGSADVELNEVSEEDVGLYD